MNKVQVHFDRQGNTLTVWFDDPRKESVCEELEEDLILMKDRRGRVIGFEQMNILSGNGLDRLRTVRCFQPRRGDSP